jgi:hypothetical protein
MGRQIEKEPVRIVVLENSPFPIFTQGPTAYQIEAIQRRSLTEFTGPQNLISKNEEKPETLKHALDQ